MKLIFLLCNVLKILCATRLGTVQAYSSLQRAFKSVIESSSIDSYEVFLASFGSDFEKIIKPHDLKNKPIRLYSSKRFSQENFNINSRRIMISQSSIALFDSIQSMRNFNQKADLDSTYAQNLQFFVHCQEATFNDIALLKEKIYATVAYQNHIIAFEYFIIEQKDSIRLLTFVWYTEKLCNEMQLVEVNRFDKITNMWKSNVFKIEKFDNFHGCHVNFAFNGHYPAIYYCSFYGCYGYNWDIIIGLETNLNFKFQYVHGEYQNESFQNRDDMRVDLVVWSGCWNIFEDGLNLTIVHAFVWDQHFIAVPPGQNVTEYEKLALPFDNTVWIMILITFFASFGTIFILSFAPLSVRNFVIGRGVKDPMMNVTHIFFGLSQVKMPGRNFARYLAMLFVIYSLIIRTAWQGKMFEFMQEDLVHPGVQSLDEMIERNFSLHVDVTFKLYFQHSDLMQR